MALIGKIFKGAITINRRLNISRQSIQESQKRTLKKLIKTAARTGFGKHYKFDKILRSPDIEKAYQEAVPFFDYDKIYNEWWHRLLKGEQDVTWPGKIINFALSSGTTAGSSKKIPISRDMLLSMRKASFRHMCVLNDLDLPKNFYDKDMLMLGGSTHLERSEDLAMGDLSGILTGNLPIWMSKYYKPGSKISRESDWNKKLDLIAQEAYKWDIGIVAGVPAWIQMLIERILEHYKVESIHDVWPNFKIYVHGGVSIQPYKKHFEELLGPDMYYLETYLASEGFVAYEPLDGVGAMTLVMRNGIFYEFIPFNQYNFSEEGEILEDARAINLSEIKENEEYAIVLSTNAGTWRYLIGDTIKFTDLAKQELVITGRIKHFLSLCGEHLSVGNMNDAVQRLNIILNLNINEFTVFGDRTNTYFSHIWWLGTDEKIDNENLTARLDQLLCELNADYKTERTAALKEIKVITVPNEMFFRWMEINNKIGGSHKFPRVLSKDQHKSWMSLLKENNLHEV